MASRRRTTCAAPTSELRWRPRNTDTREHDIADSDDYFQYHGGMVATARALTGTPPRRTSATAPGPTPYAPGRCRRRPRARSVPEW
ncbi:cobaltochelatase subunit CobN [Prescottella defluvii]|nr:cobaltochelatase subunit CobN [Prescottella defluvii]